MSQYVLWKNHFWKTALIFLGVLIIISLASLPARAEMANDLSNAGCVACHTDYPGIKAPPSPDVYKHSITNCTRCHTGGHVPASGPPLDRMWNCRYCHLATYNDTYTWPEGSWTGTVSGFKSYLDPLRGLPLGTESKWMAGHFAGGSLTAASQPTDFPVDANFIYHSASPGFQHTSVFPGADCITCHENTLTDEHAGKTKLLKNPVEDFEDGNFAFNFTGNWGGDWKRVSESVYTGVYSFRNFLIGRGISGPAPVAATQTTVNAESAGTVSFYYRITNTTYPLYFYIDGSQMLGGTSTAWAYASFPLAPGVHNLKWATSGNSAYIDDLAVTGASTTYAVDCNTCHLATDPQSKSAIAGHNGSCASCHTMASDHRPPHVTAVLDSKCTGCHNNNLFDEHLNNPVTQTSALKCADCHESNRPNIAGALAANDKHCTTCHRAGHNTGFAPVLPADIPLYGGYNWSAPTDAVLWSGEPWLSAEFLTGGRVVLSNRRSDVTKAEIRDYYLNEMTANGWTQLNQAMVYTDYLSLGFTKEGREARIFWYNGPMPDTWTGGITGCRVMILYK